MRFTIKRDELTRAITAVGKVVESRNVMPILGHLLIEADADGIRVTATDLGILATARAVASVDAAGSICVDAKLFGDIARKSGGDLSISLEGDKLTLKSGRSRFALSTRDAVDFPLFGKDSYAVEITTDLLSLIKSVSFAAGSNDAREMLNGVFLHNSNGKLVAVATDGHRLARVIGDEAPAFEGVIIPTKAAGIIPEGATKVSISSEKLRIESASISLTTKLIALNYVDYERVIPTANDKVFVVDRAEMVSAADRVVTVASDKARSVKISVSPGGVSFTASSDIGDATDEVQAEYSGEPVDVGLNSAYLRDMLAALPAGRVTIEVRDAMSPIHIKGENDNWDGTLMPMRVS